MAMNNCDINRKLDDKNHYKKRKKGAFEEEFVHYPNGGSGKMNVIDFVNNMNWMI